jgi:hypothetical protein
LTVPGVQIQLNGVREKLHELAQTRPKHAFYAVPRPVSGGLATLTAGGDATRPLMADKKKMSVAEILAAARAADG